MTALMMSACGPSQGEKETIASVTCSIMSETRNMDSAVRIREMNNAREKIGGEPFLGGDAAIKESFQSGLCQELVLGVTIILDDELSPRVNGENVLWYAVDSQIPFTGIALTFHDYQNSKLERKQTYKEGKEDGLWEEYYKNGRLSAKGNYKNGERDGLEEFYYDNGKLEEKVNYINGKQDFHEFYDMNGQLSEIRDKDGKKIPQ